MSIDPTIQKVAELTRKYIESWIPKYVTQPWHIDRNNLRGACGHASHVIYHTLKSLGYDVEIVVGQYRSSECGSHFWVSVNKSHIIDVTATQFGIKTKVCFIPFDQIKDKDLYIADKCGRSALSEYIYWSQLPAAECYEQGKTNKAARQLRKIRREIISNVSQQENSS